VTKPRARTLLPLVAMYRMVFRRAMVRA
jgi:hypothetical protein